MPGFDKEGWKENQKVHQLIVLHNDCVPTLKMGWEGEPASCEIMPLGTNENNAMGEVNK